MFSLLWSLFCLGALIVISIMVFQFGIALFFGTIGAVLSLFEEAMKDMLGNDTKMDIGTLFWMAFWAYPFVYLLWEKGWPRW